MVVLAVALALPAASASTAPAAAPGLDSRARAGASRIGRCPGPNGGHRRRPANGRDGLREEHQPLAPPGFGREARSLAHRAPGSRAALPVPDGGRRRRLALGARLARQPRPRRLRRSHAHSRGPRPPGPEIRRDGDTTHRRSRLRGRHALRHAPRRARLEVVVPRHRVATTVGARGRRPPFAGANGSAAAAARAFTEALEQRGIAVSGRPGSGEHRPSPSPSPSTSRSSCRGSSGGWTRTATTSSRRWC